VEPELKAYLLKIANTRGKNLTDIPEDEPLLESGVLDSLSLLDFVVFLEKQYGTKVPGEDIVPENFGSLVAVRAYLQARLRSAARA
jgi:acyl carrier protein